MSRFTINSNIASLSAQRRLGESTNSLRKSFTRLSSGLRINRASDDAAGLAVASALEVDRRIANQGIRNLNDGISLINVAESALTELSRILDRLSELSAQGANGTLGTSQREALQAEVDSLQDEYNRIIASTEFNNEQLLTGEKTSFSLQGGVGTISSLDIALGAEALEGVAGDRAGGVTRLSSNSSGDSGDAISQRGNFSGNNKFVVFESEASDLVSGDTNGDRDIFIKNLETGEIRLVSTSSTGGLSDGQSRFASVSSDGRYVSFDSSADNLTAESSGGTNVYRKDLWTGETIMVNRNAADEKGVGTNVGTDISADGRYVIFRSSATNLVSDDSNGSEDLFRKDLETGIVQRVNTRSDGTQVSGSIGLNFSISDNGRYISFESDATNLVDGDTNGATDVFRKDMLTGEIVRVSTDSNGGQASADAVDSRISGDGNFVVFETISTLSSQDVDALFDVYIKNVSTGETTQISLREDGTPDGYHFYDPDVSSDGRYVVMRSQSDTIIEGVPNTNFDIFRKDLKTGEIELVSIGNQDVASNGASLDPIISADGMLVAFDTQATTLGDGTDTNGAARDLILRDMSQAGIQELAGIVVANQASARVSLELLESRSEQLSGYLASVGASLSRTETYASNLELIAQNFAAAQSRIMDVDVATEAARLVRNQILQQAGAAILAQANIQPQLALALLTE